MTTSEVTQNLEIENCLICKEISDEMNVLKCKHTYCKECFNAWYRSNKHVCCLCFKAFDFKDYANCIAILSEEELEQYRFNVYDPIEDGIFIQKPNNLDLLYKNSELKTIESYSNMFDYKPSWVSLYFAIDDNNLEKIKYLHEVVELQIPSQILVEGKTVYLQYVLSEIACVRQNLKIIEYLDKSGFVEFTEEAMRTIIELGNIDIFKYFYESAEIIVCQDQLSIACIYGKLEMVKYIHSIRHKFKATRWLKFSNSYQEMLDKSLRSTVIFIRERSMTRRQLEIAEYLISIGAKPTEFVNTLILELKSRIKKI